MTIIEIPLAQIVASKTNPRKNFDPVALKELADDIKAKGVLQEILVRPLPGSLPIREGGMYEIVFGERRYRGSVLAERDTIPSKVRELSDQEALEIQMVENLQRKDLDPLEESEGYQAMLEFCGADGKRVYTVEMLAEKVKKDTTYIYRRLKLCQLPPNARQALLEGVIPIATATLIARIPGDETRKTAAQEILKPRYQDGPLSRDKAQVYINENFMRQLKGAPFDQTDPTLVPKMGACTSCPLRTGNAPEVYGDVQRGDICTHPPCFVEKSDVTWARVQVIAAKDNKKILSDAEADKVFNFQNEMSWDSSYVDLKKQPPSDLLAPGVKNAPSWKKLLAKGPCEIQVVLARDKKGRVHELLPRAQAVEAARQAAKATGQPDILAASRKKIEEEAFKKQQKAQREKAKLDQKIAHAVVQQVVSGVENEEGFSCAPYSEPVLATAFYHAGYEGCYWIIQRRRIENAGNDPVKALREYAADLADQQKNALIVELLVAGSLLRNGYDAGVLKPWLATLGIDINTTIAAISEEQKPKPKKSAKPESKKKKTAVKTKK